MLGRIERYRKYRKTVSELDSLSDRDLRDMGVSRCDIRRLARDASRSGE
jgi:uncharacterized protein YjiS (DUF1127 family)